MKKRITALLVTLALFLPLAACGEESRVRPSSSVPEPSSHLIQSGPPAEPAPQPEDDPASGIPQADDALVRQIVLAYGAIEEPGSDPAQILPRKKSLYNQTDGWSAPEELSVTSYLVWAEGYIPYDDLAPYQQEGQGPVTFFPREMLEESVRRHFEVSADYLRGDADCYDAAREGYFLPGGGGMGVRPVITYTSRQEGESLTVSLTLKAEGAAPDTRTLTVRLEAGGRWKYLGCQPEQG